MSNSETGAAQENLFRSIEKANAKRSQLNEASNNATTFKMSGDGIYLYRAFVQWFNATAADRKARRQEIWAAFEHSTNSDALITELLTQDVIECLAPIIEDILYVCESPPENEHEKLTALRDALRIGKYHAPSDSRTRDSKKKCISMWLKEYGTLEKEARYLSKTAIARRIEKKVPDISYKTAINYWEKFLEGAHPVFLELVSKVESRKGKNVRGKKYKEHGELKRVKPPTWR